MHHHQNRCRKPLQTGPFFSPNVNTSALLFKAFLITENASNLPPIRTPRTRRSFRCLLRSGYIFMRNLFHPALIGTVGTVHKYTSVDVQPNPPPFPIHGKGGGSGGYTPAASSVQSPLRCVSAFGENFARSLCPSSPHKAFGFTGAPGGHSTVGAGRQGQAAA